MIRTGSRLRGPQLYTQSDFAALSGAAFRARGVLDDLISRARSGVYALELEALCLERIDAAGAKSAMADIDGFGFACSISVDDVVTHGRPDNEPLRRGQVVTIDLMLSLDGWHADVAETIVVGGGGHPLLDALDAVWDVGLAEIRPGAAWTEVTRAMAESARTNGVRLVCGLAGHGIGFAPHELPVLPLVPEPGDPPVVLRPGMVFTLEPAVTTGDGNTIDSEDGWAIRTADGAPSAAREAMIAVENDGIRVLGGA